MSKKDLLIIVLVIGCLFLGILYLFSGHTEKRSYKKEYKEMSRLLKLKNDEFDKLMRERNLIANSISERWVRIKELEYKIDSLKKIDLKVKERYDEKNSIINNSSVDSLAVIVSRQLKGN